MNALQRIIASIAAWLKGLLAPADDPRQTFNYTYQRQRELLDQVQRALEDVGVSKTKLETKATALRSKLPRLKTEARHALVKGREDLARLALLRFQVVAIEVKALEEQLQEIQQDEQRLALVEQRLVTEIEAFFARQQLITTRYNSAEAQVHINEALSGVSKELADLGMALQDAEQKAEHMQARAAAIDRLVEAGGLEVPNLSTKVYAGRTLVGTDIAHMVDQQLENLKQEINSQASSSQNEAGS